MAADSADPSYPSVRIETHGAVFTIIIDRPERRNAIDRNAAEQLADAFRTFDSDEAWSVAVLCGAGGHFCSGADLKAIAAGDPNRVRLDVTDDAPLGPTRMRLSKPVIAAVSGYAVAGGLELACWCDLRVVEEDAIMGVFCRRHGVPLIDGGTVRLPRLIGRSRALDLILTGRPVHADEAYQMGLANRVVAPGTAREEAEKLAAELAAFPQACLRADRRSVYGGERLPLEEALAREVERGQQVLESGEARAGAQRFVDQNDVP